MPIITLHIGQQTRKIHCKPKVSLRHTLEEIGYFLQAACNGNGSCGLCEIRILGVASEPTPAEAFHLSEAQRAHGVRLACRVFPEEDLEVEVLNPLEEPGIRRTHDEDYDFDLEQHAIDSKSGISEIMGITQGYAVDIGTTNIQVSLWDMKTLTRISGNISRNPQISFGSDVLSRIMAATQSKEQAGMIGDVAHQRISKAIHELTAREGMTTPQPQRVVVAGNTAMLALLSGRNYESLLNTSSWLRFIDCLPEDPSDWIHHWSLHPDSQIVILPPLAGFVGSDLLAGVLATQMLNHTSPALLIDFGTNSEMALWNGQRLFVTSAAGGPAFEGSGLSGGMSAAPGAIYRVLLDPSGTMQYFTLSQDLPRGICGTGYVDLIAILLKRGLLDAKGRFSDRKADQGFSIPLADKAIIVSGKDIDRFQYAKAAIGACLEILMQKAGVRNHTDIEKIYVCGAFGKHLHIAHAQEIGLLPDIPSESICLRGNTCLAGCEMILTDPDRLKDVAYIRNISQLINMAYCEDYETAFMEHLFLRPMKDGA